jgi:hypothetical protein
MISALYVLPDGPYAIDGIDLWDESRDARNYRGPGPVIAHPPCERWGRYWGGGPMLHGKPGQKLLGDDGGCFAHALWSVRTFGGVLEHPEASHAFHYYGLPIPTLGGGWTSMDRYDGSSCCVAQGHYGHRAQKLTWLYGVRIRYRRLNWEKCPGRDRLDEGFHSAKERASIAGRRSRLSKNENLATPVEFRDLLISLLDLPHPRKAQP